jgi:hypothetical protein
MKETNAALEAKYGKDFLIYANLWEVEHKVSAEDMADARAYRMAATAEVIRSHKRQMKADGIRVTSCFNGGLDRVTQSANARLFALKTDLLKVQNLSA